MKNTQRGFIVPLLIIIIAVLAIGGGVYEYQKNKTIVNNSVNNVTSTQATTTIITSSAADYQGWKTYTNTTYNYTIKYPPNWYIDTTYSSQDFTPRGPVPYTYDGGDTEISNYSSDYMDDYQAKNGALAQPSDYFVIELIFTKVDQNISLADYLKEQNLSQANTTENIILNGISGVKNTYLDITGIGDGSEPNNVSVFLKRDNEIVNISYGFDDSMNPTIISTADKIVDSFILGA